MDSLKIYSEYFSKKYEVINMLIQRILLQNERIAIWGAGVRGKAFLETFDSENNKIYCVFDIDEKRWGNILPTGHRILNFKEEEVSYIFVMNCINEADIKETLLNENIISEVINIDGIILGDLDIEDIIDNDKNYDICTIRKNRIATITILYNPADDVYENICSYVNEVENAYIYDNSVVKNEKLVDKLRIIPNVIYISNGRNDGLPKAINKVSKLAESVGIDWLITFDQDSCAGKNMIKNMVNFSNSNLCSDEIGLIAPVSRYSNPEIKSNYKLGITYFDKVMQSGLMHNLKILKNVGGYDENLFIDQVDYEYCVRLRLMGYKIVRVNNSFLFHNLQDNDVEIKYIDGYKIYINKYSADRYYYIYRNNKYLVDKYKAKDAIYTLECEKNIRSIVKNAKYDRETDKKIRAIQIAEKDYKNFIMGKCKYDLRKIYNF